MSNLVVKLEKMRPCQRCRTVTPMRHKTRLCASCAVKCAKCNIHPNSMPRDPYCKQCRKEENTRRYLVDPDYRPAHICPQCGGEKQTTKKRCVTCSATCMACRVAPVAEKGYCRECSRARRRLNYKGQPPELKERRSQRIVLRQNIRDGRRELHPCQVCDAPDTLIFVTDAKRRLCAFLCKEHHAEFTTLYRLRSKRQKASKFKITNEMILENRREWENKKKQC